jgi:hypothetical protein
MKRIEIERELLESLRLGNQYKISEIAKIFNCSDSVIEKRIMKYDIPTFYPDKYNISDEELRELYEDNKLTVYDIADRIGCSVTGVRHKLHRANINIRNGSERQMGRCKSESQIKKQSETMSKLYSSGELVVWNRGTGSLGRYPYEYYKARGLAFDEWGRECIICNSTDNLCIHHIDYNKQNNIITNLIPLCCHCHGRTNTNRNEWKSLFKSYIDRGDIDFSNFVG